MCNARLHKPVRVQFYPSLRMDPLVFGHTEATRRPLQHEAIAHALLASVLSSTPKE